MSDKILHILNGDGTAGKFKNSGIDGDCIVWREILSEGPVCTNELKLIDMRADYIHNVYGVSSNEYKRIILEFFDKLTTANQYREIILWFEFDLLCQINLIYLLNQLQQWDDSRWDNSTVSLVSIDSFPGINNFLGMGQLTPVQFAQLYQSRINIGKSDQVLAHDVWNAYSSDNPAELLRYTNINNSSLHFLSRALNAHLERFPFKHDGLNRIERRILKIVEQRPRQRSEIFSEFWKTEGVFGMGDLQILNTVDSLLKSSLLSGDITLKLTDEGRRILSGKNLFADFSSYNRWNGGVYLKGTKNIWYWDYDNKDLIKI